MSRTTGILNEELEEIVGNNPGITTGEISKMLDADSTRVSSRLTAMMKTRIPSVKRIKRADGFHFYPFTYKTADLDPVEDKDYQVIAIEGAAIRVTKVTPEEIAKQVTEYLNGDAVEVPGKAQEGASERRGADKATPADPETLEMA